MHVKYEIFLCQTYVFNSTEKKIKNVYIPPPPKKNLNWKSRKAPILSDLKKGKNENIGFVDRRIFIVQTYTWNRSRDQTLDPPIIIDKRTQLTYEFSVCTPNSKICSWGLARTWMSLQYKNGPQNLAAELGARKRHACPGEIGDTFLQNIWACMSTSKEKGMHVTTSKEGGVLFFYPFQIGQKKEPTLSTHKRNQSRWSPRCILGMQMYIWKPKQGVSHQISPLQTKEPSLFYEFSDAHQI